MRSWIIALGLFLFCFIIPLQFFIIGNDAGFGLQGAVYRYQITNYGTSLIPVTREMIYVTNGTYTGKTALSIILWVTGTLMIVLTTIISLIHGNKLASRMFSFIILGLVVAVVLYLGSCVAQYGLFFSGPAGISLPIGILLLGLFVINLYFYQDLFIDQNTSSGKD